MTAFKLIRRWARLSVVGVCGIATACGGTMGGQSTTSQPAASVSPHHAGHEARIPAELRESSEWAVSGFDVPTASAPSLYGEYFDAGSEKDGAAAVMPLWVDTRTRDEFDVSHLPGAVFWDYKHAPPPMMEIDAAAAEGRPIMLYCSIGYRSGEAGEMLLEGLRHDHPARELVTNVRGGIFEWAACGGQLEGGELVHPYDPTWGKLLPDDLRAPLQ